MADHGQPGEAGLEQHGFRNLKRVNWNWTAAELYEQAVRSGEGKVAKDGPLVVLTGQHTGRSPKDKYFVVEPSSESHIWWENNQAMEPAKFDTLFAAMIAYAQNRELYVQDLYGGADQTHRLPVRVITEYAWHSLFIQHLLIEPRAGELAHFTAGLHDRLPAGVQRRSQSAWRPLGYGHRREPGQEARADRRHVLCRRDEEVRVHHPQLHPARPPRDVDARERQHRQVRRHRAVLRAFRHRQDDAVGRPQSHPHRRRRARLVGERHLQFRRRLLRQDDPLVGRGRAGNLFHRPPLRHGSGKRRDGREDARARSRFRALHREHARGLSDRLHSQHVAFGHWAAIRRTSSS